MQSHIEPNLIRSFLAFCTSPNISEAARRLALSQPAVTQQLQQLESQLGLTLFTFQGRKKILTPTGQSLFTQLQPAWLNFQNAVEQAVTLSRDSSRQVLRIAGRREILNSLADKLRMQQPLVLTPMSRLDAIQALLKNELDLAIIQDPPDRSDLMAKKILSDECVIAVHPKWLAGEKLGSLMHEKEWLQRTPSLIYKKEEPPFISAWWEQKNVRAQDCRVQVISDDWNLLASGIEKAVGYCLLPMPYIKNRELSWEPLPNSKHFRMDFFAVYRKGIRMPWSEILV